MPFHTKLPMLFNLQTIQQYVMRLPLVIWPLIIVCPFCTTDIYSGRWLSDLKEAKSNNPREHQYCKIGVLDILPYIDSFENAFYSSDSLLSPNCATLDTTG